MKDQKPPAPASTPAPVNAFIGHQNEPTEVELAAALGPAKATWDQYLAELAQELDVNIREWTSYSIQKGWALRVKRGSRTVVWLSPRAGCFGVNFIFGAKAMLAARQDHLPQWISQALAEGRKYPEGTGVCLEIKSAGKISGLKKLAAIKLAN